MWKFFFYPQWRYDRAERFLKTQEIQGYRVTKWFFFWWFKFQRARAKNTNYVFCYTFPKSDEMLRQESDLKSMYNANLVSSSVLGLTSLYRVTNSSLDLSPVLRARHSYLKKVFIQKIILGSFFFLLSIIALVCSKDFNVGVLAVASLLSLLYTLWYTLGFLFSQKHRQ